MLNQEMACGVDLKRSHARRWHKTSTNDITAYEHILDRMLSKINMSENLFKINVMIIMLCKYNVEHQTKIENGVKGDGESL